MLQEAAAAIDRGAVRAELAALVRAVGGGTVSANGSRPAGNPSPEGRAGPARRATEGGASSVVGWVVAWFVSVLLLAGVVLLDFSILHNKVATDISLLLDAG